MSEPNYKRQYKDKLVARYGEPRSLDELGRTTVAIIEAASEVKVQYFQWQVKWRANVPITYSSPIHRVDMWGEENPEPESGYVGRVWVVYSDKFSKQKFGSALFRETLTHTGTGGLGYYSNEAAKKIVKVYLKDGPQPYSWDYRFYDADWPKLVEHKQRLATVLAKKDYMNLHNFTYVAEEVCEHVEEW